MEHITVTNEQQGERDPSMSDDKLRAAVKRMFDDPRFHKVANSNWLYAGLVDGVPVGVINATYNSTFANYSLNCNESKRAIDSKSSGRIDALYVIKTRYDARTSQRRVVEVIEATALVETLRSVEPREGKHGAFWVLSGSEVDDYM